MKSLTFVGTLAIAVGATGVSACLTDSASGSDGGDPVASPVEGGTSTTPPGPATPITDAAASDGASSGAATFRVGPEHRGVTRGLEAQWWQNAIRCPDDTLLVGLEFVLVTRPKLLCAKLLPDGALGAESMVDLFESVAGEPTTLRCPAGEVAARVVGSFDPGTVFAPSFDSLGLRCVTPAALVDGGPVGAGAASVPASFGPANGAPFDDACPDGSAVGGFSVRLVGPGGNTKPSGFDQETPLCRSILRDKAPGGTPYTPARPFTLGAETVLPLTKLVSSASTPSGPPTATRLCPAGSIVTAVDGGTTVGNGPTVIEDMQVHCRPFDPAAHLGAEVAVGPEVVAARARCLVGQAVRAVRFEQFTLAPSISAASAATADCTLPVDAPPASTDVGLPETFPKAQMASELTTTITMTCGVGSVLTGVDLWATAAGGASGGSLHHVAGHCRAITR